MKANGVAPDFAAEGTMELKPWFASNMGLSLPSELDLPVVRAPLPYAQQIDALERQLGALLPRQPMKDASGASQMDAKTQVSSLYGVSMLDAALFPLEANVGLALLHEPGGENDRKLVSLAVGTFLNQHGQPTLAAAQAAREAGNAPNAVLAAALAIVGPKLLAAHAPGHALDDRCLCRGRSAQRARRELRPTARSPSMPRRASCCSMRRPAMRRRHCWRASTRAARSRYSCGICVAWAARRARRRWSRRWRRHSAGARCCASA